jgi:tRNA modification GTPase
VTPIPGTTRDRIGQTIQIEGVPLHVVDTAGLRAPSDIADEVERIGVERSWAEIARADVVIHLHDLTRRGEPDYEAADAAIASQLARACAAPCVQVYNKRDAAAVTPPADGLAISALTGEGLDALRMALLHEAGWQHASGEGLYIARTRHVQALHRARQHMSQARGHADRGDAVLELVAEELRLAHHALGEITGQFTTEDLLGEIFGRFCIGK